MNQIKQVLDNHHTTEYGTTHKDLFDSIEQLSIGEFVKIEYNKLPNRKTESEQLKAAMDEIADLKLADLNGPEHKQIVARVLKQHQGERKTEYYKRGNAFRNESGYLLLQDENDGWKSVDIRNTVSITNMDGVKKTRIGQRS